MGAAKLLRVEPIASGPARRFMQRHHYSGKVVNNSSLHLGVFYRDRLEGALQFGPPLDRRKLLGLVEGTAWSGMIELNRMAFTEALPRNSESRALGVALRMLRRKAPHVEWVVSFADATQCGDGTIYRAAGFILTAIKRSEHLARLPDGTVVHEMSLKTSRRPRPELGGKTWHQMTGGSASGFRQVMEAIGAEVLEGFQLRYLYFLNPAARERLKAPELPFSAIAEAGAGMYRGESKAGEAGDDRTPSGTATGQRRSSRSTAAGA